jgi:hypothetical protein
MIDLIKFCKVYYLKRFYNKQRLLSEIFLVQQYPICSIDTIFMLSYLVTMDHLF